MIQIIDGIKFAADISVFIMVLCLGGFILYLGYVKLFRADALVGIFVMVVGIFVLLSDVALFLLTRR